MTPPATPLGVVARDYRDQLAAVIDAHGFTGIAARAYDDDPLWPRLCLAGPGWVTSVEVIPTSDGVVLDLRSASGQHRLVPTWGREPGAVALELLTVAAPPVRT